MFENEEVMNEMVVDRTEEVNFLVIPEEVCTGGNEETEKELNGVLIGAALAATGVVAYKLGPKVINKVKKMWNKESKETLEERQTRLLAELSEVNSKIAATEADILDELEN